MTILKNIPIDNITTYIVALIPIIIYVVKLTINNWGITDLEKIYLSNFKKFQITITKYLIWNLVFTTTLFILIMLSDSLKELKTGNLVYGVLIFCSLIFSISMFLLEKFIDLIGMILSVKYDYYIVNDSGEPIYRIIKMSNNNLLLVESNGIEEFIDPKEKRKYKRIRRNSVFYKKIYSSNKMKYWIIVLITISLISFIFIFLSKDWKQFWSFLVWIITMIISLTLTLNYWDNRKRNPEQNNQT